MPLPEPVAAAVAAEEVVRSSLVLAPALASLPPKGSARLLDLGHASGANVAFFRPYCRSITIADLDLAALGEPDGGARLPTGSQGPFDLIITWDRFNYLSPPQLEKFAAELSTWCHESTRLVAFIYYSQEMPARPCQFHVRSRESVTWIMSAGRSSKAPRYKEPILLRACAGFEVERVFLLRHGVEEFLLRYRG